MAVVAAERTAPDPEPSCSPGGGCGVTVTVTSSSSFFLGMVRHFFLVGPSSSSSSSSLVLALPFLDEVVDLMGSQTISYRCLRPKACCSYISLVYMRCWGMRDQ